MNLNAALTVDVQFCAVSKHSRTAQDWYNVLFMAIHSFSKDIG
ncbi:MAG: hypothetical protein QX198_18080 [Methylococcaceae bacterium]